MAQFVQGEPRRGFIYVIAEKTSSGVYTGYYKVGKTQNLDARIAELQTGNPHELEYVWKIAVDDMDAVEQFAHDAFRRKYRSNENGGKEWYYARTRSEFLLHIEVMLKGKDYPGVTWRPGEGY